MDNKTNSAHRTSYFSGTRRHCRRHPKTIHLASQQHNVLSTAADLSMSVGKRLIASVGKGIRLFTQSVGIQAIAGKGKVQIQAQSDVVEFIAEQVLRIISAKKSITPAAAEEIPRDRRRQLL